MMHSEVLRETVLLWSVSIHDIIADAMLQRLQTRFLYVY